MIEVAGTVAGEVAGTTTADVAGTLTAEVGRTPTVTGTIQSRKQRTEHLL
jgi:hypothetical protein